jgi:BirA family biotin operon repressor/biotin-[acetyl-CoA-carboxylase] ligase
MLKESVLKAFIESAGAEISGGGLAKGLGVTRAAVWKAVSELRRDGYEISAKRGGGYTMEIGGDIVSEIGVRTFLAEENQGLFIEVFDTLESTNTYAKGKAVGMKRGGAENIPLLVLAREQSAGRGRLGREFFSKKDRGIFMSLLLKPRMTLGGAAFVTVRAAVCTARAIEKLTGEHAEIKWVNDLFLNGKKICGILTEAVGDFESGALESLVIGIGLNVNLSPEEMPESIRSLAGALRTDKISKNALIAEIVNGILNPSFFSPEEHAYIEEYRKRSCVLQKNIFFQEGGNEYEAFAEEILENGNLKVGLPDGGIKILNAGEIGLKKK